MSGLKLRGIRKSFGAVEVIKGVDLDIESREFVVFVGPSGCGKSTLLRMIAGPRIDHRGRTRDRRQADERRRSVQARHRHGVPDPMRSIRT